MARMEVRLSGIKMESRLKIYSIYPRKEFLNYLCASKTKFPILLTMNEEECLSTALPAPDLVPADTRKSM
jgi:hypothetical protein